MFKKTVTAAVAALTLAGALVTTPSSAQAGSLGKAVAIGIVGTVVGVMAGAAGARSRDDAYHSEHRPARGGYDGGFRQVRGGYDSGYGGCGFRKSPVFDEYGNRIGSRQVPAC